MIEHFLIPYQHSDYGRALPVHVDSGYWEEAEIEGDQAIVRVRSTRSEIRNLASNFKKIDPYVAWTPVRRLPWSDEWIETKTLEQLEKDVLDDKRFDELKSHADGIFKLLDHRDYVRIGGSWQYDAKLLSYLGGKGITLNQVSTGTFPVNGTIDDFNRADSAGSLGSNWTGDVIASGWTSWDVASNAITTASSFRSNWYNLTHYDETQEVFITITTEMSAGNASILARIKNPGTSTVRMYELRFDPGTNGPFFLRWDNNGGATQIGGNTFFGTASGEKIGLECIQSTLTLYRDQGSGFSALATRTDSNWINKGYLGIITGSAPTGVVLDDFSGGSIPYSEIKLTVPTMRFVNMPRQGARMR